MNCPCEITVVHAESDSGVYANVEVSRYRGTQKLPPLMSDPVFFSLHRDDFSSDTLEALPGKLKDKIKNGETYKNLMAERALAELSTKDIIDDDIPFG